MKALLADFGHSFWRLLPANPILVRVVYAGGRRKRHLYIRVGFLAVLWVIVLFSILRAAPGTAMSQADLAKNYSQLFRYVAMAQLAMVCLLAPIFAATAITQERDSQTYNILLSTPLTNAQIVFGSLMSRLYFIFVLLFAALPIFAIMMVYGGVTFNEIAMASGLAATTAAITGSLAICVSVIRVGTRRTIFWFYLVIGLYLMGVWALADSSATLVAEAVPPPGVSDGGRMSWLAAFHPFLALQVTMNQTPAPAYGVVAHYGRPWSFVASYPAYAYMIWTTLASIGLCAASVSFVRAGVKEGEPTWFNRVFGGRRTEKSDDDDVRTRKPRTVWQNAVAWREAATSASGGSRMLQRVIVIIASVVAAVTIIYLYTTGSISVPMARSVLQAVVGVELGLAMLVATNTAATGLTREKEGGTLDIMLVTPLTSRDILWGKCRGLITFAVPMLIAPYATVLMICIYDLISGRAGAANGPGPVAHWSALISLIPIMVGPIAAASALGLRLSVTSRRTVQAIVSSVGVLILAMACLSFCAQTVAQSSVELGAFVMPASPITGVFLAINPEAWLSFNRSLGPSLLARDLASVRTIGIFSSYAIGGVYVLAAVFMYRDMVSNFDMIIRKQMA